MIRAKTNFCLNLLAMTLLLVAFFTVLMDRLTARIEEASAGIVAGKQQIRVLADKNSRLADSRLRYAALENQAQEVFSTIIDKGRTVAFITAMEQAAADSKLRLRTDVAADKNGLKAGDFISSSKYDIKAAGSFDGLMHFLYALENFQYEVDVSNVQLSYGDFDQYSKDLVILTCTVELYQKNSAK